jgi:hypothetical protein
MTIVILFCIGVCVLNGVIKASQEAELRKTNPEAWVRLQELELQEKRMRREGVKNAAGFGLTVARLFMGK